MLRIGTSDAYPVIITPELTRPFAYLDSCVISELAETPRGEDIREALLAKGGTLYVG